MSDLHTSDDTPVQPSAPEPQPAAPAAQPEPPVDQPQPSAPAAQPQPVAQAQPPEPAVQPQPPAPAAQPQPPAQPQTPAPAAQPQPPATSQPPVAQPQPPALAVQPPPPAPSQPPAAPLQPMTPDQRGEILAREIRFYISQGYRVVSQTQTTAQLVKPKQFIWPLALITFFFFAIPFFIYIFIYIAQKDRQAYVEIDDYGRVLASGTGVIAPELRYQAPPVRQTSAAGAPAPAAGGAVSLPAGARPAPAAGGVVTLPPNERPAARPLTPEEEKRRKDQQTMWVIVGLVVAGLVLMTCFGCVLLEVVASSSGSR